MSTTPASPPIEARILVVDDEENIRRLLKTILTRMPGFRIEVEEAGSAEEGMDRLKGSAFDLVVSDYRMPGKTGVDLLESALGEQPSAGRILITAFAEMDIGVDAINRGHVDGFLRKPWDNAQFVALVQSLLHARHAPAPLATVPVTATGASEPSGPSPEERAALQTRLTAINLELQKLRVRLGLGSISPEGYQKSADKLGQERGEIEAKLTLR